MASLVSKNSKLESLSKILRQEKADGFQDTTVMGGLDKFLQLGADELEPVLGKLGSYSILTPDEAVAFGKRLQEAMGTAAGLGFHPLMGGMPLELGQESLDLVVSEVMPRLRD